LNKEQSASPISWDTIYQSHGSANSVLYNNAECTQTLLTN
jgi:hypothetical protein